MKSQMEIQLLAILRAIIDQASDGLDRSDWILKQAKLALSNAEVK